MSKSSAPEKVAYCGYAVVVPAETTVTYKGENVSGGGKSSYQNTSQISYNDKQSGCYGRATATEKVSAGDFHWKNGTSGTRSEYKETSTVRVGNSSGYTEVYNEQRVRDVSYSRSAGTGNNQISYDRADSVAYNGGSGAYGGGGSAYGGGGAAYGDVSGSYVDHGAYGDHDAYGYDSDGYGYDSDY